MIDFENDGPHTHHSRDISADGEHLQDIDSEIENTFLTIAAVKKKEEEQAKMQELGNMRNTMMSELKEKMQGEQKKEAEVRKMKEIEALEEGEIDFNEE